MWTSKLKIIESRGTIIKNFFQWLCLVAFPFSSSSSLHTWNRFFFFFVRILATAQIHSMTPNWIEIYVLILSITNELSYCKRTCTQCLGVTVICKMLYFKLFWNAFLGPPMSAISGVSYHCFWKWIVKGSPQVVVVIHKASSIVFFPKKMLLSKKMLLYERYRNLWLPYRIERANMWAFFLILLTDNFTFTLALNFL